MALPKKDHFLTPEVRLADYCKALAHPARIAILKVLAERGTCMCGEVVNELPLAQATVSQHLRALKEVGLIRGTFDGPRSYYSVDPEVMKTFTRGAQFLFSQLHQGLEQAQIVTGKPKAQA